MSSDFLDIRFPEKISFGASGGPEFLTDVIITASGREARNQNWSSERLRYEVAHAARLEEVWRPLQAFFRVVAGRAHSFRFKDWTDYSATHSEGVFLDADSGSPLGKQMYKLYSFGGQTYYRKITKPVVGKITTDAVGLDYTTGIATSGSYWYGEFDVHVRFDTDEMKAQVIDKSEQEGLIVGWNSIPLVEVLE